MKEELIKAIPNLAAMTCLANEEEYGVIFAKGEIKKIEDKYYISIDMKQFGNEGMQSQIEDNILMLELASESDSNINEHDIRTLKKGIKRPQNLYTAIIMKGEGKSDTSVICHYSDGSDKSGREGLMEEIMSDYLNTYNINDIPAFIAHLETCLVRHNKTSEKKLSMKEIFPDYNKYIPAL